MLQPLLRIFDPIMKNASKELLQGSHTRAISISTPSNSGIMKFAKKQLSCVGCKALIRYQRILCFIHNQVLPSFVINRSIYILYSNLYDFSTCLFSVIKIKHFVHIARERKQNTIAKLSLTVCKKNVASSDVPLL